MPNPYKVDYKTDPTGELLTPVPTGQDDTQYLLASGLANEHTGRYFTRNVVTARYAFDCYEPIICLLPMTPIRSLERVVLSVDGVDKVLEGGFYSWNDSAVYVRGVSKYASRSYAGGDVYIEIVAECGYLPLSETPPHPSGWSPLPRPLIGAVGQLKEYLDTRASNPDVTQQQLAGELQYSYNTRQDIPRSIAMTLDRYRTMRVT